MGYHLIVETEFAPEFIGPMCAEEISRAMVKLGENGTRFTMTDSKGIGKIDEWNDWARREADFDECKGILENTGDAERVVDSAFGVAEKS